MEKKCEGCGSLGEVITEGPLKGGTELLDYCLECSKDLCKNCMAKGCCGIKPARSGMEADGDV